MASFVDLGFGVVSELVGKEVVESIRQKQAPAGLSADERVIADFVLEQGHEYATAIRDAERERCASICENYAAIESRSAATYTSSALRDVASAIRGPQ